MPKQTNKYTGVKEIVKNILYEVYGEAGKKSNGTRDRFKERFHGTQKKAVLHRASIIEQIEQGTYIRPAKQTVGEYLHWWLEHLNDNREEPLSEDTIESYLGHIKNHLVPAFGGLPLDKLNVMHIQKYRHDAREQGQKPRRKKTVYESVVEVNGQDVHRLSGDYFVKALAGQPAEIGGKTYIITAFRSVAHLDLAAPADPPIQKKVSFNVDLAQFVPLAERTINYSLIVLRMALDDAVNLFQLIRDNPAKKINISAQTKRKKTVIAPEHVVQVFSRLSLQDRRVCVYALFSGERRGEILGTLWTKLDPKFSAVKVDRQLKRITGQGIRPKKPKTERGNREVDLGGLIAGMLKEIHLEQTEIKLLLGPDYQDNRQGTVTVSGPNVTWIAGDHFAPYLAGKEIEISGQVFKVVEVVSKNKLIIDKAAGIQKKVPYLVDGLDLVFCQYDGRPLDPDGVSHRFKKACRAAGVPNMRFHDLRHNFASWALGDGEKIHVVQELLGHEEASTTIDIYGEAMPGSHRAAVDRFDKKYGDQFKDLIDKK